MNAATIDWGRELLAAGLVSACLVLLMVAAETWRRLGHASIENTRKLVHLGSGFTVLPFSWIFQSHWTVLGLGVLFIALMATTRRLNLLPSVHAVERRSQGDVLFPLATYLTYMLAWYLQQPLFYSIAMGILALSDTLAALVGKSYGNNFYEVENNQKSLEGSAFFFISAFLIIHIALLLFSPTGRLECVLIAFWIASMVTVFEAVSTNGTDNFFIPLGTFYLLWKIVPKPVDVVVVDIVTLYSFLLLTWCFFAPRRKLDLASMLAMGLLVNASFRLLSWNWGLAVVTAMVVFNYGHPYRRTSCQEKYQIRSVFYGVGAVLVWVLISNLQSSRVAPLLILPFFSNIAAILSIGWDQADALRYGPSHGLRIGGRHAWHALKLWPLFYLPQIFFHRSLLDPRPVAVYFAIVVGAGTTFAFLRKRYIPFAGLLGQTRLCFAVTIVWAVVFFFVYRAWAPELVV